MILREEVEYIPEEELYNGLKRLVVVEYILDRLDYKYIDDVDSPPKQLNNYNNTWRLWTGIPTEEQRASVKWKERDYNLEVN